MHTTKIDAENAFRLLYELFRAKPWLLESGGTMKDGDAPFEDEALSFLLTLETADDFGQCPEPARRVASSLLVDFMHKLRGPFADRTWIVPAYLPPWRQAVRIVCAEIRRSHPRFARTH